MSKQDFKDRLSGMATSHERLEAILYILENVKNEEDKKTIISWLVMNSEIESHILEHTVSMATNSVAYNND